MSGSFSRATEPTAPRNLSDCFRNSKGAVDVQLDLRSSGSYAPLICYLFIRLSGTWVLLEVVIFILRSLKILGSHFGVGGIHTKSGQEPTCSTIVFVQRFLALEEASCRKHL